MNRMVLAAAGVAAVLAFETSSVHAQCSGGGGGAAMGGGAMGGGGAGMAGGGVGGGGGGLDAGAMLQAAHMSIEMERMRQAQLAEARVQMMKIRKQQLELMFRLRQHEELQRAARADRRAAAREAKRHGQPERLAIYRMLAERDRLARAAAESRERSEPLAAR
jgi:hypothetical protein